MVCLKELGIIKEGDRVCNDSVRLTPLCSLAFAAHIIQTYSGHQWCRANLSHYEERTGKEGLKDWPGHTKAGQDRLPSVHHDTEY